MERLTDKKQSNYLQSLNCIKDNDTWIYLKLSRIEDLMEKYNIENLEQLDIMLFVLSGETKYRLKKIQEEKLQFKNRWSDLKDILKAKKNSMQITCHDFIIYRDLINLMQELEKETINANNN